LGKFAPPSSTSRRGKTGEGDQGAGGPGARRRAGAGEKGKGSAGNRFPLLIWADAVYRGGTMAAGGGRRPVHAAAALRGPAAARVRGEMSREARAFYCPPHLGLEWNEEAARRWHAAAGGGARSGGAAQLGRRLVAVVGVVVVVGDARALL